MTIKINQQKSICNSDEKESQYVVKAIRVGSDKTQPNTGEVILRPKSVKPASI
jgi:hypothetical protein